MLFLSSFPDGFIILIFQLPTLNTIFGVTMLLHDVFGVQCFCCQHVDFLLQAFSNIFHGSSFLSNRASLADIWISLAPVFVAAVLLRWGHWPHESTRVALNASYDMHGRW